MGRTLAALLRQPGPVEGQPEVRSSPPAPEDEEVPFIEIGPQRGVVEASASVLATAPAVRAHPPAPVSRGPHVASVVLRPAGHSVTFHPVVERRPGFPPELVAYHSPGQPVSAPYRELLPALLGARRAGTPALLFLASTEGIGTTTVLLNVAITAAQQGRRVLVVDANLSAPAVAERLGLEPAPGVREALAGHVTIEQALQPTEQAGLLAVPAGEQGPVSPEREPVRFLLRLLRERCDLVLVDGPVWDGEGDFVLGTACDAVYLVVRQEEAEGQQVQRVLRRLREVGARVMGRVLIGG